MDCPMLKKVELLLEVLNNGIRETFMKHLRRYVREHNLEWAVMDYVDEGYPELIGVVVDETVQADEAEELVHKAVKEIGLDFLVEAYSGRLSYCYVTLIKPEWIMKYALGKDYERLKEDLRQCKEKLETTKQMLQRIGEQL